MIPWFHDGCNIGCYMVRLGTREKLRCNEIHGEVASSDVDLLNITFIDIPIFVYSWNSSNDEIKWFSQKTNNFQQPCGPGNRGIRAHLHSFRNFLLFGFRLGRPLLRTASLKVRMIFDEFDEFMQHKLHLKSRNQIAVQRRTQQREEQLLAEESECKDT